MDIPKFLCFGEREPLTYPKVGSLDGDGTLWKDTAFKSGKPSFTTHLEPSMDTCYTAIKVACARYGDALAVGSRPVLTRTKVDGFEKLTLGPYEYLTYTQYFARIEAVGSGLTTYDILSPGDTAMIYADTQLEWMLSAFGCWHNGCTVATCYATLGEDGALFAMAQSKCKVVFADAKLLKVLANIADKLKKTLKLVVTLTDEAADSSAASKVEGCGIKVAKLSDVETTGKKYPSAPRLQDPTQAAVLMYTSGTTGNPKGVLISHANISAAVGGSTVSTAALGSYLAPGQRFLAYLPLAHIMEFVVEMSAFCNGMVIGYGGVGTILPTAPKMLQTTPPQVGDAAAFGPNLFLAAPAVLDRLYAVVNGKINAAPGPIKAWFKAALANGAENYEAGQVGANPILGLIFKPVQKLLGGQVRIIGTGSAPLGLEIAKFCATVFGCPVIQGYGLTETTAVTCLNLPHTNNEHSVGPPQQNACLKLRDWEEGNYRSSDIDDPKIGMRRGEVLIGGPAVTMGYYIDPSNVDKEVEAKNKEDYITIDGVRYFCTGDIGRFTPNGTLEIIDRKKDLVKLQMGEYVALSKVENALKSSRFVSVPLVHALPTKSYCIALICPTPAARDLAKAEGLAADAPWSDVCKSPGVTKGVLADLQSVVKGKLSKHEIPTKCILIDDEFSVENEMMTAVRKLKRKPIHEKHEKEIAAVYT